MGLFVKSLEICIFQVCSELDDEKKKHAQDTAQGDDVTYMLEKERERLKQEVISIFIYIQICTCL